MVNIDPNLGTNAPDAEPLRTMASYRYMHNVVIGYVSHTMCGRRLEGQLCFGVLLSAPADALGTVLKIGDSVTAK